MGGGFCVNRTLRDVVADTFARRVLKQSAAITAILLLCATGAAAGAAEVATPSSATMGPAIKLLDQLVHPRSIVDGPAPAAFDWRSIKNPTIVLFWASWCPHCKTAAPVVERQGKKFSGRIDIVGVSVDEDRVQAQVAFGGTYSPFKPGYWIGSQLPKGRLPRLPMIAIVKPGGQIDTVYEGAQGDKMEYFRKRVRYLMGDQTPLDQASGDTSEAT